MIDYIAVFVAASRIICRCAGWTIIFPQNCKDEEAAWVVAKRATIQCLVPWLIAPIGLTGLGVGLEQSLR